MAIDRRCSRTECRLHRLSSLQAQDLSGVVGYADRFSSVCVCRSVRMVRFDPDMQARRDNCRRVAFSVSVGTRLDARFSRVANTGFRRFQIE